MLSGKKIIVVMPAYNAAATVEKTFKGIDRAVVDEVILVDDGSQDNTVSVAKALGITTFRHEKNLGYGGNQKTCYAEALKRGADVVVMIHPDYQYEPKLASALAGMVASGVYDCVLGSRILGKGALKGGMPLYKYVSNRFLTFVQNVLVNQKLSEYHTGYRAFTKEVLESIPLLENSNDFVFDNQMLGQIIYFGFSIGEVSCPTKYFAEASSINFFRSVKYGFGVLAVGLQVLMQRLGLGSFTYLSKTGEKLGKK